MQVPGRVPRAPLPWALGLGLPVSESRWKRNYSDWTGGKRGFLEEHGKGRPLEGGPRRGKKQSQGPKASLSYQPPHSAPPGQCLHVSPQSLQQLAHVTWQAATSCQGLDHSHAYVQAHSTLPG